MKVKPMQLSDGTRSTHSSTMTMALRKISESDLDTLQRIASDLETGLRQSRLNQHDAQRLLGKVRREIAERHFH